MSVSTILKMVSKVERWRYKVSRRLWSMCWERRHYENQVRKVLTERFSRFLSTAFRFMTQHRMIKQKMCIYNILKPIQNVIISMSVSLHPCCALWWRARWTIRGSRSCLHWSWRWPADYTASSRAAQGTSHSPPQWPSHSQTQILTEVEILPDSYCALLSFQVHGIRSMNKSKKYLQIHQVEPN